VILAALLASLPLVYWTEGVETSAALRQAGIERIGVPADRAREWNELGFTVVPIEAAELSSRDRLVPPGITAKAETVSATRSPWVFANGWKFLRSPSGRYVSQAPAGKAPLAAAEAFAYGADVLLRIDAADVSDLGRMLAFLRELPERELPAVSDLAVVDDGSPLLPEVLNLLVRRNLLFRIVDKPETQDAISIRIGSKEYSKEDAADPSAFALKVRRQLTDERRSLRVYGSEAVIGRLTADGSRARLHLLNYGGREIEGLRLRVRGAYPRGDGFVAGVGKVPLQEHVVDDGATEFTLPKMGLYAVVDVDGR
jgi:hypothetical protein